ncbi:hypothetical protein S58_35000 [Bradyrhizobium oligotrophicum S58]|uniref:Novel STAND NTPase 1 domain-containing protein n=1 Tax=Bradyrhizobium oligotrophicum S58 TaxID=1245469 RepID=M4Z7F1_9BRAD|nr:MULTISPECIES: pentapeptide repeat-containing protein [Bradyrhizobium]BAM89493.1 hypothetical protein S58_35000 [Bradyrhizobium oligotrophicum S58]
MQSTAHDENVSGSPQTPQQEPFVSLQQLQHESDVLIDSLPDAEALPDNAMSQIEHIAQFIARATETGAVLDSPAERKSAQALIDFWSSKYYALSGTSPSRRRVGGRNSLRGFDSALIKQAVHDAEITLASFSAPEREIARRILLRLVKRGPEDGGVTLAVVERKALATLDAPDRVAAVLDVLIQTGLVTQVDYGGSSRLTLRFDTLTREWPVLQDWIAQRQKFAARANFWQSNGRRAKDLAPELLAKRALADYGDLDAVESDYVAASLGRGRRDRWARMALTAGLLACVVLAMAWWRSDRLQHLQNEQIALSLPRTPNGALQAHLNDLADQNLPISLQNREVRDLDLAGLYSQRRPLAVGDFVNSTLHRVVFDRAVLSNSAFSQATLNGVNFVASDLSFARFDGAVITSSSFANAKLYRSLFDRARLSEADFSDTDLRSTSFWHVKLMGRSPNFTGTAWWLAFGWSRKTIEQLAKDYPREALRQARTYQDDVARSLTAPPDEKPIDRAVRLNDLAWTYAIYGIDLDSAAKVGEEAAAIYESLRSEPTAAQSLSVDPYNNLLDTRAYIFLQQGKIDEAKAALEKLSNRRLETYGASLFKYAVARTVYALGRPDPEKSLLTSQAMADLDRAIRELNYVPSHELYLLAGIMTDDFKEALQKKLAMEND